MKERSIVLKDAKAMVGPGWAAILTNLYKVIPKRTVVVEVKEKYGSLRFYIASGSNRTYDLIEAAEKESETTCEVCGKPGEILYGGWYKCRCPVCAVKETTV